MYNTACLNVFNLYADINNRVNLLIGRSAVKETTIIFSDNWKCESCPFSQYLNSVAIFYFLHLNRNQETAQNKLVVLLILHPVCIRLYIQKSKTVCQSATTSRLYKTKQKKNSKRCSRTNISVQPSSIRKIKNWNRSFRQFGLNRRSIKIVNDCCVYVVIVTVFWPFTFAQTIHSTFERFSRYIIHIHIPEMHLFVIYIYIK